MPRAKPKPKPKPKPPSRQPKATVGMSCVEYLEALEELELQPQSRRTAELLGLSVRQAQRLALGEQNVTDTIARLISMYQRHGLPQ